MSHETAGLIGVQVPWKQIRGATMRVDSFESFGSKIVDGKVVKILGAGMPIAVATVETLLNGEDARAASRAQTGSDSLWLLLPIQHADDFRVFLWVFEERGVAEDEEVWATYVPAPGLMARFRPRLGLAIFSKGTLREMFDLIQRGEEEPDTEPVWMHAPYQRFVKPAG
ncbi:MAG: hypothetical protein ACYDEB_14295 [Dehalococcoidia bacterium]